ncbi:hypothetical protein L484_016706 [Morus notabilis]|uniref:Transmembrane protein 45B n=1 Tax=Morus notabilis TaxID=981085 RepID=W9REV7_9ROSA|nr:transmembrane protein 45B [Morus notabilis]EXB87360.1 hypothetical protein L484_016706 [Morus notabilis]
MGTLVGHVAPGMGFLLIGLWHLFNHIKLHALHPTSYTAPPWFPASKLRHLELFLIMAGSAASVAMELFIGPKSHQPLDPDGTIPSNHLHNFEHSSISLTFFSYALLSLLLDKYSSRLSSHHHVRAAKYGLTQFLGAVAFGQQLLLFHLHSADHMGPEGQYHSLLQLAILVSVITTLMGIGYPKSFMVSFIRSLSIFSQGVWLVVMGFMLWTPSLIPKGCFMHFEEGHHVVRCSGEESLHRAKSLVNLQFSWLLIGIAVFGTSLYMGLVLIYGEDQKVEYFSLGLKEFEDDQEDDDQDTDDVESQKKSEVAISGTSKSFIEMGKSSFGHIDIER